MGADSSRPARPVDKQGGRVRAARLPADDPARLRPHALRLTLRPGRRQTIGEWIYDIAQSNIAEQGLPSKAISLWFPYVATLFLFIWVLNMVGFIPLPLSDQTFHLFGIKLPTLAIYAATSQLSVTLALAFMTFFFTHIEGIRFNGPTKYFKSWIPDAPK